VAAPHSPASVRSRLLAAEREEAKAVLSLFLRQKGLRSTLAARIVNKSDGFIEHLVSKLQIAYRSRYAEGFVIFFFLTTYTYWSWTFF
jgi:mTERF domain-containing protein, mitochondrial